MTTTRSRLAVAAVTLGLCLGIGGTALAQGHTPDPYNIVGEYNRQYEPYMYATVPNMPGVLPNQERYYPDSGYRTANQFQHFLESEEEGEELFDRRLPSRMTGPGTPYWRANRQYDQEFGRQYRPNAGDRTFYNEQRQRTAKYFEAMRETNPRRRAQLLREYNLENLRAAHLISAGRSATPESKRDVERDRFSPESPVNPPEEAPEPTGRRPAGRGTAPPRGSDMGAPSFSPRAPGRRSYLPGSSSTGAPPPSVRTTPGFSDLPGVSDVPITERIRRNALMERARRAIVPTAPRSSAPDSPTAPPPR